MILHFQMTVAPAPLILLLSALLHTSTLGAPPKWTTKAPPTEPPSASRCGGLAGSCAALRATVGLVEAAARALGCSGCSCEQREAEATCLAFLASIIHICKASPGSEQQACVTQELDSGLPAGLQPCSSAGAVCAAVGHFTRTAGTTLALTCPHLPSPPEVEGSEGREGRIACSRYIPCIYPFHQGTMGPQNGGAPVVWTSCSTDAIVAQTLPGTSLTVAAAPAGEAALGLADAKPWCAIHVNAAAATGAQPRGASLDGFAVDADQMVRWRYCSGCP